MPRARSRSSRSACSAPTRASASSSPALSGSVGQLLLGHAEAHAERDQPRLGAVVEVALDPAQLAVLDVHGAGPARLQRLDALRHLGAARGREHGRHGLGPEHDRDRQHDPHRPEVTVGGHRPHADREQDHDHRHPGGRSQAPTTAKAPDKPRALAEHHQPGVNGQRGRERQHHPDRPEVTQRCDGPDDYDDRHHDRVDRRVGVNDPRVGAAGARRTAAADVRPATAPAVAPARPGREWMSSPGPRNSPDASAPHAVANGCTSSSVNGSSAAPIGTRISDSRNVCTCQKPRFAPWGTNGTHRGAAIMPSATPSRLNMTTAIGKPTNQRSHRNPWARQKLSPNRARTRAQKPAVGADGAGACASTPSSERAISASTAAKPLVM